MESGLKVKIEINYMSELPIVPTEKMLNDLIASNSSFFVELKTKSLISWPLGISDNSGGFSVSFKVVVKSITSASTIFLRAKLHKVTWFWQHTNWMTFVHSTPAGINLLCTLSHQKPFFRHRTHSDCDKNKLRQWSVVFF